MNSNRSQKISNKEPTALQSKFIAEFANNKPLWRKAQDAGYKGKDKKTLAVTAQNTIKNLQKKGIINTFDKQGLTEEEITNNLKDVIDRGLKNRTTTADSLKALELVMKARGDFAHKTTEQTQSLRIELDGLSNEELKERLEQLEYRRAKELQV
jgi:hypothetical protein